MSVSQSTVCVPLRISLVAAALASAMLLGGDVTLRTAQAAVPPSQPGAAIVSVRMGGDRSSATTIAGLAGVKLGLFATQPTSYDSFTGYTTAPALYTCVADADGDCNFTVPIGTGGQAPGVRLWVAPLDGPPGVADTEWFANPVWQTAPLAGTGRHQTRHVFQTPALYAGSRYLSGTEGFLADPGSQTSPANTVSEYTRRIASGGVWPLSRVDPELPPECGLNVALVVDLSSSMNGSVGALKSAMSSFVESLRGTPSEAQLFTFSTDTPAVRAGPNSPLMPVATTADANRFKALYSGWTESTADGYTNWDRALAAVAEANSQSRASERFDLVVFLTDGLPTVFGPVSGTAIPVRSGFTRFREMENAVASANLLKRSGGREEDGRLIGGTRILAVGVGSGLDAGSDVNLRSISGRTEYDGTNLPEADFFRTADYAVVGERLRELFLAACAPSVTVIKQIVPHDGTIADAYTPPEPWHFTAATTTTGASVSPASGETSTATGALNFDLSFDHEHSPAGVEITEDPKTEDGYTPYPVDGHNAVCENKSEDDAPVPVQNIGSTGFHVDVGLLDAVSCVVYNQAPDFEAASIVVHKRWRVSTSSGMRTYPEGAQPAGLSSHLRLGGPEGAAARDQPWSVQRDGYRAGDSVTLSDRVDLGLPGCTFSGASVSGSEARHRRLGHRDTSTEVTLAAGANSYTITNDVECHSHLILHKQVEGGSADPSSWTLQAIGPDGALPGPDGTSGVRAEVTDGVAYQLAEHPNADDPSLANYVQGSMACEVLSAKRGQTGYALGEDGSVVVPLGEEVECVATNRTAQLTLIKQVLGGSASPSDFAFTVMPVGPNPAGAPAQTVAGAPAPGVTINVRPGQQYQITETNQLTGYQLAYTICTVGEVAQYGGAIDIPAGASATCTLTNSLGPPPPSPLLPPPAPPLKPTPEPKPPIHPANVTITKHASRKRGRAGQQIDYDIVIRTVSKAPAQSLRICDRLPTPLVLVRAPGGRANGGQICWTVETMPYGGNRAFQVVARIPRIASSLTTRNTARVSGVNVPSRKAIASVRLIATPQPPPQFTG